MANELEFIAQTPAATHYVHVYDPAQGGAARNVTDGQWDADEDGTWSKYTVAATRVGSTSRFRASLPSGTDAAVMYDFQAFEQAGGSEANSDSPVYFAAYIPGNVPANVVDMDDGVIAAATFNADVDAEILSYIVDDATRIDASALNTAAGAVGSDGSGLTEAGGTGDHLTAINLPNQTMDITGNITGNLSGSVGSVTGAVGSVTGNVGGNVAGSVASVTAGVTLANDAITAAKFDETTAFPLKSADSGTTTVARAGSLELDTLATLSAQLDTVTSYSSAINFAIVTLSGSSLTALPWNAAWGAEVESEVADALASYGASTHSATDVWAAGTRTLTANTNLNDPTATTIADAVLSRAVSNVENAADKHSLGAVVMIATNAAVSGTTLTAKKPSDDTTFQTYTVTVDAAADPITGVS